MAGAAFVNSTWEELPRVCGSSQDLLKQEGSRSAESTVQWGSLHFLKQKHVAGKVKAFLRDLIWSQSNFKSARTIVLVLMCFGANSGLYKFVFQKSWLSRDSPFLCTRSVPCMCILRALSHHFSGENLLLLVFFLLAFLHSQGCSSVVADPYWHRITCTWANCIVTKAFGRCQVGIRALLSSQ